MSMPFAVRVQHLLPQRLLCAFIYCVSRSRIRWFKSALIDWFAKQYRVDLDEAAEPRLSTYASFNDFFTRALRPGARSVDARADALVSPADGTLTRLDAIDGDTLIQAKGFDYSLAQLLGEPTDLLDDFDGGHSATIYLAPHNYHRVHVPVGSRLVAMRYIAGRRFSVNATTARWIDSLYCRNERLVCWFETEFGRYAVVLVGALNVSSIATTVTGEIRSGADRYWPTAAAIADSNADADADADADACIFERGDEFARFNLGSTVVLAFPRDSIAWSADVTAGSSVTMGTRIGRLLDRSHDTP